MTAKVAVEPLLQNEPICIAKDRENSAFVCCAKPVTTTRRPGEGRGPSLRDVWVVIAEWVPARTGTTGIYNPARPFTAFMCSPDYIGAIVAKVIFSSYRLYVLEPLVCGTYRPIFTKLLKIPTIQSLNSPLVADVASAPLSAPC